ncbi:MAG: D-aminoacylase [Bryobacteraceae bacterium]|nr:D-aminoacylase [Bryobacteraceae bacterium]
MERIVLRGGVLFDGLGGEGAGGDVLIAGERIAEIGRFTAPEDARVIDCAGLAVAPGFIDAHSHSDLQVLEDRREKTVQGVTTEVVGNCGFSAYPAGDDLKPLRDFANGIFCGDEAWGWRSAGEYLRAAAGSPAVNVASLVGHGSLRIAVAGNRLGRLNEREVERMEGLLDEALAGGACGFSTGLMYAPGSSAPLDELERLCRVTARRGKTYATHMRSYFSGLVDAVEEQIELARRAGCRLQISHLQAVGANNWPLQERALEKIEEARGEGIDIAFDCYPYVAGSTVLTQALPQWVLEGGIDGLLKRLADPAERARIERETEAALEWRWSDIYISAVGSARNQGAVGKNLAELSEARGRAPVEAMTDLLAEERGAVNMLCFNQSEENLRRTLAHPLSNIISDGFYVRGRPHPRLHGTFPLLLGEFCRKRGWLRLGEAINKITDRPARRFGIRERGRLAPGYFADVTVFDPAAVDSPATYDSPEQPPTGIRYVLRNGRPQRG